MCFKYTVTAALNHVSIGKHPERISKIRPYIGQYDWNEINFSTESKDLKKFERNNKKIAVNVLLLSRNGELEKIRQAYISKDD